MRHNFYHYPRARRKGKRGRLVSLGTVRLNFDVSCIQNSLTLSSKLAPYFLMPIMIKGGKSMTVWTHSKAFACFIDKGLVWQYNLALVEKMTPVAIKMIDGWNLSSRPITHETNALIIIIGSHSSTIVFNVIPSSTNPIIIGLSWLVLLNPWVDWKMKSLHFESINKITRKYEAFLTSMLDSEHHSTCEDLIITNQHMHKLKHEGDIRGNEGSKHFKFFFMGARHTSSKEGRCVLCVCHFSP